MAFTDQKQQKMGSPDTYQHADSPSETAIEEPLAESIHSTGVVLDNTAMVIREAQPQNEVTAEQ